MLATPPRIVHVRESWPIEDQDDFDAVWLKNKNNKNSTQDYETVKLLYHFDRFQKRYQTELIQPRLHPNLVHFACNWKSRIASRLRRCSQTSLDSYGFTSCSAESQPWLPTKETPKIPLHWLQDNLEVAFELIRESYLYSEAPIPPFLHTYLRRVSCSTARLWVSACFQHTHTWTSHVVSFRSRQLIHCFPVRSSTPLRQ